VSIKKTQMLKQLQSRKAKLEVSAKELEKEAKEKQQEHSKAINQLKSLYIQITNLQNSEIIVSEHAIIRYMERAMGLDIKQISDKILTSDNILLIENMGDGKYPIGEGLRAVVKNNTVVSIA